MDDFNLIEELSTFVIRPNKTYAADEGKHDDLVMCALLFAWATTQPYFKDLTDSDMRTKIFAQRAQQIEEEMPPVPMHSSDPMLSENQSIEDGIIWTNDGGSNWFNKDNDMELAWGGRYSGFDDSYFWKNGKG